MPNRSAKMKVAVNAWTGSAGVADGHVFRPVNRGGQVQAIGLSEKVVWQLLQGYAAAAGVPGIAPHDLRRYAECRIMPNGSLLGHPWRLGRCAMRHIPDTALPATWGDDRSENAPLFLEALRNMTPNIGW